MFYAHTKPFFPPKNYGLGCDLNARQNPRTFARAHSTHSHDLHVILEIYRSHWIGGVGLPFNLDFEVSDVGLYTVCCSNLFNELLELSAVVEQVSLKNGLKCRARNPSKALINLEK
jgi:hypothetical protein